MFHNDIQNKSLWICETSDTKNTENGIIGVCAITCDQNPEYADCGWNLSEPAIVPHRLAIHPSYQRKGIAKQFFLIAEGITCFCYEKM